MNNDLISRDALKKALTEAHINMTLTFDIATFNCVMNTIDNAPTVEAYPFEQVQELVKLNQQFAQEIENLKRPQGEWIDYDNTFYKCPDCGYLLEKCCPQCQNKVILPKGGAE